MKTNKNTRFTKLPNLNNNKFNKAAVKNWVNPWKKKDGQGFQDRDFTRQCINTLIKKLIGFVLGPSSQSPPDITTTQNKNTIAHNSSSETKAAVNDITVGPVEKAMNLIKHTIEKAVYKKILPDDIRLNKSGDNIMLINYHDTKIKKNDDEPLTGVCHELNKDLSIKLKNNKEILGKFNVYSVTGNDEKYYASTKHDHKFFLLVPKEQNDSFKIFINNNINNRGVELPKNLIILDPSNNVHGDTVNHNYKIHLDYKLFEINEIKNDKDLIFYSKGQLMEPGEYLPLCPIKWFKNNDPIAYEKLTQLKSFNSGEYINDDSLLQLSNYGGKLYFAFTNKPGDKYWEFYSKANDIISNSRSDIGDFYRKWDSFFDAIDGSAGSAT